MAKKLGKLAGRYARALNRTVISELGSAGDPTPAQQAASSFREFSGIWESDKSFRQSILNPMFEKQQRIEAIVGVAKLAGLSELLVNFLKVLCEKERVVAISEISDAFTEIADKEAGVVKVEVVTARELKDTDRENIATSLSQKIEGKLDYDWRVDASIIGGLVVRFDGKVLDGSVGGRLERIKRDLLDSAYIDRQ